jgi:hypothetical protein
VREQRSCVKFNSGQSTSPSLFQPVPYTPTNKSIPSINPLWHRNTDGCSQWVGFIFHRNTVPPK